MDEKELFDIRVLGTEIEDEYYESKGIAAREPGKMTLPVILCRLLLCFG